MTNRAFDRAQRLLIGRGVVSITTGLLLAVGMFVATGPNTVLATGCPCTLWPSSTTPSVSGVNDSSAVELGVKFTSDLGGYISAIRFYKDVSNYGQHIGNLWTASGQLLATAKFANESPSGWQQVQLADPVPIAANTVYIASYHTNTGHWAMDQNYFSSSGVDSGPLHAPSSDAAAGNGVYALGGSSAFPNQTYNASNYWIDVVLQTTAPATPPQPISLNVGQTSTTISVDDGLTFAAVFDKNQGGGITNLYDLVNDPSRTRNLGPQPGYSVFNSYLKDATAPGGTGSWGLLGSGPATTFEITDLSSGSVTVHVISPYYCEVIESSNCGNVGDIKVESWTTLYPGGHVYFERRLITGLAHTLQNVAPSSTDLCLCGSLNGIYENVASDTAYPSPANVYTGTGGERWWGTYQSPNGSTPSLGVVVSSYRDNPYGWSYNLMRLIVGTAYLRNHVTPRTESQVQLAPNTTYVARYEGWISQLVNSSRSDEMMNDYRTPALTVTKGSASSTDPDLTASGLVSGYNPGTGRYVLNPASDGSVQATLGFPSAVFIRYRPTFKVLNWKTAGQSITYGSQPLVTGTDYQASIDADNSLRVTLLFDVVPALPLAGQRTSAAITITPSGVPLPPPPPVVRAKSPLSGATGASLTASVTATFNKPVVSSTINFTLSAGGAAVPATLSYNSATNTASLQPNALMAENTTYTASLSGAQDSSGTPMTPLSWSFTTLSCPCSLWPASAAPANITTDTSSIEVGLKFTSDVSGYVTGVRFYKASGNTGTHVGSLWSSSGQLLATAIFSNETASGWQQVSFSQPVAISANTIYIVSYHTTTGRYAYDPGAFSNGGLDSGVLHAPSAATPGGNGVYTFSSGTTYPNQTYGGGNYWVDAAFAVKLKLAVTAQSPVSGATNVSTAAGVTATFNKPVVASSISFVLATGGASVAASLSYNASSRTATLAPNANLAENTSYTATLSGVQDLDGATLSPMSWSFATMSCPCSLWPASAAPNNITTDGSAIELGVKFTSDVNGYVSGVRFYKGAGNTGAHTGELWSSSGQLLATATFTAETASGWQAVSFSQPVAITANTVYVVSYHTNTGHYAFDAGTFTGSGVDSGVVHAPSTATPGGNGVYAYASGQVFPNQTYQGANYWVDLVFTTRLALAVTGESPPPGAINVGTQSSVSATFNKPVVSSTINFTLSAGGAAVPATLSYNSATNTASVQPNALLAENTTYTASLSGAQDSSGTTMTPLSWSFTTLSCPCSLWPASAAPANISTDTSSIEVGLKFTSDVSGYVTGVRFYKASGNTGTHVGSLWSSSGQLLATATFSNESASGWQQVNFSQPVAISANTIYIVSYHTTTGRYAYDPGAFSNGGLDSGVLHAPSAATPGGNGVYTFSSSTSFPNQTYSGGNYWVDVVFTTH